VAATIAICATYIKKVLAYSTISQLGYMITGLGCGAFAAGLYHLWTHAFFKALLFLASGSVIHAVHTQEMPEMGGLRRKMPITFGVMLIATLAISGVPGFSGFFSKDAILAGTLAFGHAYGGVRYLPFVLLLIGAGITAFYMFRLIFMTFEGKPRDEEKFHHAHESPPVMTVPLLVLAFMAIFSVGIPFVTSGWFHELMPMPTLADAPSYMVEGAMVGAGEHGLVAGAEHAEAGHGEAAHGEAPAHGEPAHVADGHGAADAHGEGEHHAGHGVFAITHDHEHAAHVPAMIMSIIMAGLGILISWLTYGRGLISAEAWGRRLRPFYVLFKNKWFFDEVYHVVPVQLTLVVCQLARLFDTYVIDAIVNGAGKLGVRVARLSGVADLFGIDGLVNGVAYVIQTFGRGVRKIQTGRVQSYVYGFMGVVLVIVIYRMFAG
jgi:NADH-quinone oxidoreductase subunit L